MSIGILIVLLVATCVVVYVVQQGMLPAPFNWIALGIVLIVWLVVLLNAAGIGINTNTRIGMLENSG